jgi:8-oxo-dGTP diphosphatase
MRQTPGGRRESSLEPGIADRPHVLVTAAVVERDGRFLVARRLPGTHLEGLWEFPGGKCHPGEAPEECLRREMIEELAVDFIAGSEILVTTHHYPERSVELRFFRGAIQGEPRPVLGQEIMWVRREDLASLVFPPADELLVQKLTGRSI